ncbi:DUF4249 domain-containing protein [Flavobacterium sp.]|uniref:DUF4249 domain-containing protein n=1 Tax=Flavobacterium sp. TaxID=239 RepID=UPI0039E617EE
MEKSFFKNIFFLVCCCLTLVGCTDPYALQTNNFESALVVEGTVTNELKTQEIRITRTFRLEETKAAVESDAVVYVTDSDGVEYEFVENGEKYTSVEPFQALAGKSYRLTIITREGKTYRSTPETLTTVNPIQELKAAVVTNSQGERGVEIRTNSFDPNNTSKYYRYEYEETYKIIAPTWSEFSLVLVPPPTPGPPSTYGVTIVPRENLDTKICYSTKKSDDIILTSTNELSEDRVDFPVRFISDQSYIISHRYSILVRQYVQNLAAYTFYKTLKEVSSSGGNILSQNQPGFFYGNLKSVDNPDEKIIGFFEVASVSSKRIFFNYADLFPGEDLPPYVVECGTSTYLFCFGPGNPQCRGAAVVSGLQTQSLIYVSGDEPSYVMSAAPCGDCTLFSSNVIPPFWED